MRPSFAATARTRKALQFALLSTASFVALAALISAGRATPFFCDDTGPSTFNFTWVPMP